MVHVGIYDQNEWRILLSWLILLLIRCACESGDYYKMNMHKTTCTYLFVLWFILNKEENDTWNLRKGFALFESEYEAVTWLCAKTKPRTSQITWLWQNESSSGTVLHCEMFRFFDFEASVLNVTTLMFSHAMSLFIMCLLTFGNH